MKRVCNLNGKKYSLKEIARMSHKRKFLELETDDTFEGFYSEGFIYFSETFNPKRLNWIHIEEYEHLDEVELIEIDSIPKKYCKYFSKLHKVLVQDV